jgi:serine/threonine protein kinase
MVTGRVPFMAETPVAIVFKHIQDPLPSARKLNTEVPEAVEDVLRKALAKNPDDRYQSAEDFVLAIQAAIPDSLPSHKALPPVPGVTARVPDSVPAPAPLTAAAKIVKPRPAFVTYGLAGITILFVLLGGVWGVNSFIAKRDPTQTPTIVPPTESPSIPITAPTETPTELPSPTATLQAQAIAHVVVSRVTLYQGPALGFKLVSLTPYPRDTEIILLGRNLSGLWFLSQAPDGAQGWLYKDWLEMETDPMTIPTAAFIPVLPPTATKGPGGGGGGGGEPTDCGSFCQ